MFCNILYGESFKKEQRYQKIYRYLDKYCDQQKFLDSEEVINKNVRINKTIWIAWLQGLESAPQIVQRCFASVRTHMPADFDLILIESENIKEYIKLPGYIEEKYEQEIITRTHLSDIIRTELLYNYGGCWIDATVYCSGGIPNYMLSGELFAFRWSLMDYSTLMTSSWWIYAKKGQSIIEGVRVFLNNYWKHENKLKDYFLFHIIFSKVVNQSAVNRDIFDNIPYFNNSMPHVLYWAMPKEFNQSEWEIIKQNSPVHKLSYKNKYIQGDIYNFYMAFLDGKLV